MICLKVRLLLSSSLSHSLLFSFLPFFPSSIFIHLPSFNFILILLLSSVIFSPSLSFPFFFFVLFFSSPLFILFLPVSPSIHHNSAAKLLLPSLPLKPNLLPLHLFQSDLKFIFFLFFFFFFFFDILLLYYSSCCIVDT